MNQVPLTASQNGSAPQIVLQRILKIENLGDGWRKQVVPSIRLKGQWLSRAGFNPSHSVAVTVISPGVLEIRCTGESAEKRQAKARVPVCRGEHIPAASVHFDFWVSDHGSLTLFHPQTHKAHAWLKAHCPADEDHRYWCGALAVEVRFVADLLGRASEDGLVAKL